MVKKVSTIPTIDASNLVKKDDYNTKIEDIEKKMFLNLMSKRKKVLLQQTSKFNNQKSYCWFRKKDRLWWKTKKN